MFRLIRRLFKRRKKKDVEVVLGYKFRNPDYLFQALTHPSYLGEGGNLSSYERLEFLGDAVLGFLVSDYLFRKYPHFSEGELTQRRSILVSGKALAQVALKIGLGQHIRYAHRHIYETEHGHPAVLADIYEAVVGAIYLDGGIKGVKRFLERFHLKEEQSFVSSREFVNFKGKLLELLQAKGFPPPEYKLERVLGPEHRRYYIISAWSQGKFLGVGEGFTRKDAEQQAAERAISAMFEEEK